MARPLKVWYDAEGDYLEVLFSDRPGFMRETNHHDVMERVDEAGHVLGFSILGARRHPRKRPLEAELA
jgi:uncharacterized protein YuzE